jgi:hypothetical protein
MILVISIDDKLDLTFNKKKYILALLSFGEDLCTFFEIFYLQFVMDVFSNWIRQVMKVLNLANCANLK